jgi:hypothetical protein
VEGGKIVGRSLEVDRGKKLNGRLKLQRLGYKYRNKHHSVGGQFFWSYNCGGFPQY